MISRWLLLGWLLLSSLVCANDAAQLFVAPLIEEGIDPYSEDLYLYLLDANESNITVSVEDGTLLLVNEQVPNQQQRQALKVALTDLQQQGPVSPQASQAIDYIIKVISEKD